VTPAGTNAGLLKAGVSTIYFKKAIKLYSSELSKFDENLVLGWSFSALVI